MAEKQFAVNTLINDNRKDFDKDALLEEHLNPNPFHQFEIWLQTAIEKDPHFANAMTLSTIGNNMVPDCRIVLLRNISYGGLTFFSNYESKKGVDLAKHRNACLHFFWKEEMRQVKVQGEVKFLPVQESDDYFKCRPFDNQVGAWASQQSRVVKNREELDAAFDNQLKTFTNKTVPRPEHWGGYVLLPELFEFWQGRPGRLHDRIQYTINPKSNEWKIERLMP